MPRIKTLRHKKYPEGWDLIEGTLNELAQQMKDSENESSEGKRRVEIVWKIY